MELKSKTEIIVT